jgi:hypothetical protein
MGSQDFKPSFCFPLAAAPRRGLMLQFSLRNELNSQRSGRSSFLGVWKELNGDGCCSCIINLGRRLVMIFDSEELLLLLLVLVAEENGDAFFLLCCCCWENGDTLPSSRGLFVNILFGCGGGCDSVMVCFYVV